MSATAQKKLNTDLPGAIAYRASADVLVAIAALVAEALIVFAAFSLPLPLTVILLVHAGICALLFWHLLIQARHGADITKPALLLFATIAAGPLGAAISVLAFAVTPRRERREVLEEWYQRIALVVDSDHDKQTSDQVLTGRVTSVADAAPQSFFDVIHHGTLEQKQSVLGIIARRFHPEYAPALAAALKSPEPVVRVQAAAVAAHVSQRLDTGIEGLMHWSVPGALRGYEASGAERECHLLASGELKAFRNHRRRRRISALGFFRIRPRAKVLPVLKGLST
jgi:hypothetical protein